MTEQDPNPTQAQQNGDESADAVAAPTPSQRQAGWLIPVISLAAVLLVGIMLWSGRPAPTSPAPAADTQELAAPLTESQSRSPAQFDLQPTAAPVRPSVTPAATQEATPVALPTVTPTVAPSTIPSRTLTFGGTTTLRLMLKNDSFASSGRPLERTIEPRVYALGSEATTVIDSWCMQLGVASLLFDITLALNPINGTVKTTGSLNLHSGFCDAPGPQWASTAIDLEVPADASAQVVQSLQAESHMLGVSDLLNVDTGVFVELVISNTRRQ